MTFRLKTDVIELKSSGKWMARAGLFEAGSEHPHIAHGEICPTEDDAHITKGSLADELCRQYRMCGYSILRVVE